MEVKRLIKQGMDNKSYGATKISFNIWFFKLYFITLYFGKEQRSTSRIIKQFNKMETYLSLISIMFSIVLSLFMVFAIFMALYYIKSYAGIDIFEDRHLEDFFKF